MYNKKYHLEKIEEFSGHNPIYEGIEGKVCYLAYLNVGERCWFLWVDSDWFDTVHRIHTSVIKEVIYTDNQVFVETQNTRLTFKLTDKV